MIEEINKANVTIKAKNQIVSNSLTDQEALQKAFSFYLNNLTMNDEIESYCKNNGIDPTYIGYSSGEFYKTLSSRHNSFQQFTKLELIDKTSGKDKYSNHLVIPQLEGAEIVGLKFICIDNIGTEEPRPVGNEVLRINNDSFKVSFSHRTYIIQGLIKSPHILKATVKFNSGENRHVDVVNFYSAGNRKRLIQDICETFRFPYEEIKNDIQKLMDTCEKQSLKPKLSNRAKEVLSVIGGEFTSVDIKNILMWNPMPVNRAIK
jgi:hypothetical protein